MRGKHKRSDTHLSLDERLVFEEGSPGRHGFDMPALDVPSEEVGSLIGEELLRDGVSGMPELSELDVIRHFTRISTWNYHIDLGMYPLGSCTMKYNPKINEKMARLDGFALSHPYMPVELVQGSLAVQSMLQECLSEISGMDAVTLQPAAGAHGELTGLLMIRAYHQARGNPRKKILIPDSAHGTNPASVTISGYEVRNVPSNASGTVDIDHLRTMIDEDVAGIMITNPNTLGIFESQIAEIVDLLHSHGALVYMDGANLNAMMGITRPGDFGIDVLHINLHKTFTTPHGGGGPGSGPVAVKAALEPFLPYPTLGRTDDGAFCVDHERPQSIGKVKAFYGQFGMHVRALCYILANGPDGLRETSEIAVLNANYIRRKLEDVYDLPYDGPTLHEVVFFRPHPDPPWRPRRRHRQTPDGLRIPPPNGLFSPHRPRCHHDRAHRNRKPAGTGRVHRSHASNRPGIRRRPRPGPDSPPHHPHRPHRRSRRRSKTHPPVVTGRDQRRGLNEPPTHLDRFFDAETQRRRVFGFRFRAL